MWTPDTWIEGADHVAVQRLIDAHRGGITRRLYLLALTVTVGAVICVLSTLPEAAATAAGIAAGVAWLVAMGSTAVNQTLADKAFAQLGRPAPTDDEYRRRLEEWLST